MKLILCEGDSWTGGHFIDPKLEKMGIDNVNDRDNDDYRLPKLWPYKLGKLLNKEVINMARAGSSNDGIVRRIIHKIPTLLQTYKPKDLFVIIGWTSPERKDFYYKGGKRPDTWETLYPAQLNQDLSFDPDLEKFYKIYLDKFWNEEEYFDRYIQHNLLIHYFLKSLGINHLFFDAFYEIPKALIDVSVKSNVTANKFVNIPNTKVELIQDIRDNYFVDTSFRDILVSENDFKEELFSDYHPTEKAQDIWANYLYNNIKDIK